MKLNLSLFFGSLIVFAGCAGDNSTNNVDSRMLQDSGGGIDTSIEIEEGDASLPYGDYYCRSMPKGGYWDMQKGKITYDEPSYSTCASLLKTGDSANGYNHPTLIIFGSGSMSESECDDQRSQVTVDNSVNYLAYKLDYQVTTTKKIPNLTYKQDHFTSSTFKSLSEADYLRVILPKISTKTNGEPYKFMLNGKTQKADFKINTGYRHSENLSPNSRAMGFAERRIFYCNYL